MNIIEYASAIAPENDLLNNRGCDESDVVDISHSDDFSVRISKKGNLFSHQVCLPKNPALEDVDVPLVQKLLSDQIFPVNITNNHSSSSGLSVNVFTSEPSCVTDALNIYSNVLSIIEAVPQLIGELFEVDNYSIQSYEVKND